MLQYLKYKKWFSNFIDFIDSLWISEILMDPMMYNI